MSFTWILIQPFSNRLRCSNYYNRDTSKLLYQNYELNLSTLAQQLQNWNGFWLPASEVDEILRFPNVHKRSASINYFNNYGSTACWTAEKGILENILPNILVEFIEQLMLMCINFELRLIFYMPGNLNEKLHSKRSSVGILVFLIQV